LLATSVLCIITAIFVVAPLPPLITTATPCIRF
jgi:hypothetical protein